MKNQVVLSRAERQVILLAGNLANIGKTERYNDLIWILADTETHTAFLGALDDKTKRVSTLIYCTHSLNHFINRKFMAVFY